MSRLLQRCFGLLALLALYEAWGCSRQVEPRARHPSLVESVLEPPPFVSPGRWQYHPPSLAGSVRATSPIGQSRLLVTDRGERWLVTEQQSTPLVASALAPEPLDGLIPLQEGGWVFVGRSGTTYEAREPVGPFERFSAPTKSFAAVSVTPRALVGVTTEGELQRSENLGVTWQGVEVAGRVADVALLPSGSGLALLAPERLLITSDFGRTWSPLGEQPFGAVSVAASGDAIVVGGVLGARAFKPGAEPRWQSAVPTTTRAAKVAVPPRADARAVVAGSALLDGDQYFELLRAAGKWKLRRGPAQESLEEKAADDFAACEQLELTGSQQLLFAVCATKSDTRVFFSRDQGGSWKRGADGLRADFDVLRLTTLGERLVVSGICPPKESNKGCLPSGVYVLRFGDGTSGARFEIERINVPQLKGLPLGLGVGRSSQRLFVIGRRTKSDSLVVYSTDEQRATFRAEEVPEFELEFHSRSARDSLAVEGIVPGPDGNVSIVLQEVSTGQRSLLLVDASGNIISTGEAPLESALLGGAGAYAVAVDPEGGDAWESLDGGVTWDNIGTTPAPLCEPSLEGRCSPRLVCWQRGCLFDDIMTRIGWRGQEAVGQHPMPPVGNLKAPLPQLRTPIACRLDVDDKWTTLGARAVPDASSAQLGDVAWFALNDDYDNGSVQMHEAVATGEPHVETVTVLPSAPNPSDVALYATIQVEGIAAFRQSAVGAPTVVWRNLFEGRQTHVSRVPTSLRVSTKPTRFNVAIAQPELLSISRGGVFLRTRPMGEASPAYFVRDRGLDTLPALTWPRLDRSARAEMIRADDTPMGVSIVQAGAAIVRLRQQGGRWQHDAMTLGLLQPRSFSIRQEFGLAYFGDRPGFHLMFLEGRTPESWWFPFSGGAEPLGAPLPVPSQAHLPSAPAICSPRSRGDSPRLITPSERDTRHAVLITHTTEPLGGMLTDDTVLHGSVAEPCVAAFHAEAVGANGAKVTALIVPDGSNGSWLFRAEPSGGAFDYRRMNCDYDPTLEVPSEVDAAAHRVRP